jgi:hypothetical protein
MNITATKSGVTFSGSGDSVTNTINYGKDKTVDEDDEDNNNVNFKKAKN